jgi:hypothetical protein
MEWAFSWTFGFVRKTIIDVLNLDSRNALLGSESSPVIDQSVFSLSVGVGILGIGRKVGRGLKVFKYVLYLDSEKRAAVQR